MPNVKFKKKVTKVATGKTASNLINNQDRSRVAGLVRQEFKARKEALKLSSESSDTFENDLFLMKKEMGLVARLKQLEQLEERVDLARKNIVFLIRNHPKAQGVDFRDYGDPDSTLRNLLDKLKSKVRPTFVVVDKQERMALAMIEKAKSRTDLDTILNTYVLK